MNESIFFFLCICWWSNIDPTLSRINKMCKIVPVDISYSSNSSKFNDLKNTLNSQSYWCINALLHGNQMDLYPYLKVDFGKSVTIVGLAIKGAGKSKKYQGFQSLTVYQHNPDLDIYEALKHSHPDNQVNEVFPGMSVEDIVKNEVKVHNFSYPLIKIQKLKVYFKIKPGQRQMCLRIEFYQDPGKCGNPIDDKDMCNEEECDYICHPGNYTFHCECIYRYMLWIDGLTCVRNKSTEFKVENEKKAIPFAQEDCTNDSGILATIIWPSDYQNFTYITRNITEPHLIGAIDVDHDQSYRQWIHGLDISVDNFEDQRRYPGSISLITGVKDGNKKWGFHGSLDAEQYICCKRYGNGFLFTGPFGIQDYDFSSSSYRVKISLASFIAFGAHKSQRNSKGYATTSDTKMTYGQYWSPESPNMPDQFIQFQLRRASVAVIGGTVLGFNCKNPTINIHIKLRSQPIGSKRRTKIEIYNWTTPAYSRKFLHMRTQMKSKVIIIKFDGTTSCEGYQWDLIVKPIDADYRRCRNKCEHRCIKTPISFFCVCKENWHLFVDERQCMKESKPNINGLDRVEPSYNVFKNVIRSYDNTRIYYHFVPVEMSFTKAIETCREFGGYLPSFHAIHEHRLLYKHLDEHASCKKWFLGLNGTSLLHSAWHDHSWVDFALFVDTVPETFDTEQVVYMNKEWFFLWGYDKPASTKACVICQYRPNECSSSILAGPWKMPMDTWTVDTTDPAEKKKLPNIILDLKSGLNFFESKSPKGYVEIVFPVTFEIHILKCASKTNEKQRMLYSLEYFEYQTMREYKTYLNRKNKTMMFGCGQSNYVIWSYIFNRELRADKLKILWDYEKNHFTIKLDFIGCPAYTKFGQNIQCGSKTSLYAHAGTSYECMHIKCPLHSFVCSPYTSYYKKYDHKKQITCNSSDICATKKCFDGKICLDFGETYECHCPATEGNCEKKSNTYMMIDKREVILQDIVTIYYTLDSRVATFNYLFVIGGSAKLTCKPSMKTVRDSRTGHTYSCGIFKYQTSVGGIFDAMLKRRNGRSNVVHFMVRFPESVIYQCFKYIKIIGAAHNRFDSVTFKLEEDVKLKLSHENKTCGTFKITKYQWIFSHFDSVFYQSCISDEKFKKKLTLPTDDASVQISKGKLPMGYYKVCVQVDGKDNGKVSSGLPITCAFFIITTPLIAVIKPSDKKQVAIVNRPFTLDASESRDPNGGDISELSFDWFCKPVNSNGTCDFRSHLKIDANNKILVKGAILKVPPNTIRAEQTYNFTVVVSKPKRHEGTAWVSVYISGKITLDGAIRCLLNCEKSNLIPTKLTALQVDCKNCGPNAFIISAYIWQLYHKQTEYEILPVPYSAWRSKSPTGNNKNVIVLLQETLNSSSSYELAVTVYYDRNTSKQIYKHNIETNDPPVGGSCSVDPKSGHALNTQFTVSCPKYSDSHSPLMYRFYQERIQKTDTLLYYGHKDTAKILLSAGPPKSDHWVQLVITISDSLGTSTKVSLSVQVHGPKKTEIDFLKWLYQEANNIKSKPPDYLSRGLVIAQMLEPVEITDVEEEKKLKTKILNTLLNTLKSTKVAEKDMLFQMSDLLERIMSMEEDISSMAELALSVSRNLEKDLAGRLKTDPYTVRKSALKQCSAISALMDKKLQLIKPTDFNKIKAEVSPVLSVLQDVATHLLNSAQKLEGTVNVHSDRVSVSVQKADPNINELKITANPDHPDGAGGAFFLPNDMKSTGNNSIDMQMLILKKNPFKWSKTAENVNLPMMNISVKQNGKTVKRTHLPVAGDVFITSNLSEVMEKDKVYGLNVTYDSRNQKVLNSSILRLTIPAIKGKTQILKIFTMDSLLKLQIVLGTTETDISLKNLELHGFMWPMDKEALLTYKNHKQDPYLLFLPEELLREKQTDFYLTLRIKPGQIIVGELDPSNRMEVNVALQTFTAQCSYWNEEHQDWRDDGCMVSPFTTMTTLHCWTRHLSVFSGGIFVSPNWVDPVADVRLFLTFFDNPVVVTLVVAVWILYMLILVWARRSDKKDLRKTGITMLADNNTTDRYVYMLCVVTGWWAHAGTTSRVFIYLCGKNGRSSRHALFDSSKKLFFSGAENWFMLKTSKGLGKIKSLVVWHDNSGEQPSWYMKEIVVKDVQTDEVWHCLYDEWLSVDKGLGTIQADIPAIEDETYAKKRFYQFMQTSSRDFRNGHIWISIFSKPPISDFTRTQRLTCALGILMTTMLTNIMFHGIPRDDPQYQIDYGDFHVSIVDFVIGIESSLIVFPINLLIILMFKYIRPKADMVIQADDFEDKIDLPDKNKTSCSLPWYFIFIAYFLAVSLSVISSYLVMLYGLKYGYQRSVSWLVSFFSSFFQSAFVTEPVKVFAVAFLLTLVFKKSVSYESGTPHKIEQDDYKEDEYGQVSHQIIPVSQRLLKKIRTQIVMDQRTWEILVEIVLYFTYVAIVLLVVLGHSDVKESYSVTKGIEDLYIHSYLSNDTLYFYNVTNSHKMWEYINNTFVETAMFGPYTPISNSVAYLVGRARLRQIRVHRGTCLTLFNSLLTRNSSEECFPPYSIIDEDTDSYTNNWKNDTTHAETTMWTYQSAVKLGTLPIMGRLNTYSGGGYILQLPRNPYAARELIQSVKKTKWIDEQTRAVFLEFTLFNPNVQLFTVVELLFEYSNTGFVFPYHLTYTANFYHYQNEFETFVAVVEILFVIYLFIFTCDEMKKFLRMSCADYFNDSWTAVELGILGLAYTIIGLFINRLIVCNNVMGVFDDNNFDKFANFHTAAFYDALLRYVMAALILLVILKVFKLLRFNARLSMLSQTLYSARGMLFAYSFSLFGVAMAFAIFAVLVFGTVLEGYRNFPRTVITMFLFMLGQSDYYGLQKANPVFGPLFFFIFSVTFQFIFVQYFITLLMDAFHTTRVYIASVKTEVHMVQYICRKFRLVTMLETQKKQSKRRIVEGF